MKTWCVFTVDAYSGVSTIYKCVRCGALIGVKVPNPPPERVCANEDPMSYYVEISGVLYRMTEFAWRRYWAVRLARSDWSDVSLPQDRRGIEEVPAYAFAQAATERTHAEIMMSRPPTSWGDLLY